MLIRIVAVGTRMPAWVETAVTDYASRFPPDIRIEWREVRAEDRARGGNAAQWTTREAQRIRQALPDGAWTVALDERGIDLTTVQLSQRLARWRDQGQPLAILIGGPDGLEGGLKAQANETLRLSSLTLPHAMVRVLLAEQLYRAWSILTNHPYHRA